MSCFLNRAHLSRREARGREPMFTSSLTLSACTLNPARGRGLRLSRPPGLGGEPHRLRNGSPLQQACTVLTCETKGTPFTTSETLDEQVPEETVPQACGQTFLCA